MAVDLLAHQSRETTEDVAIVRIELLYPFPVEALKKVLAGYPNKQEVVWVQEEPHNMSALRSFGLG
jgi:2-oxoglutarate dehydrogenase E1 component